jgi:outer membrane lipoprotein-sorting protein
MRIQACLSVLALVPLLAGCGAAPPRSQFPSADDALARMRATYACGNGVAGVSKIDRFSPEGRVRGEVDLLAVNPDRVRFDVVSPFGVLLYTLTSNGKKFQMLDVKSREFLHGPADACNIARLTEVPLPANVLVSLLRGEAPVLVHEPQGATLAWDKGGFYRVVLQSSHDATQELRLAVRPEDRDKPWQEQRIRVEGVRVSQRGADLYDVELSHHEPAQTAKTRVDAEGIDPPVPPSGGQCEAEIPRSIRMQVPHTQSDVIFQYKSVAWNPPLIQGAFSQPVPGGVRQIYVDCVR